ncbi:hypothetical protein SAY86_024711 [Trapa natans]|uniref:Uncharacterized protein n=1 Tax=Trapa natans TaxID=22666 RepID=A0AAN7M623_TRANT|nr:hypothetical protein SAY86_024711 [Trapa natans]
MSSVTRKLEEDAAVDSMAARFNDSLSCGPNKPDYRELDLCSPVSPLMNRHTASNGAVTTSSSSCSSSGSVTGKATLPRPGALAKQHSAELSDLSEIQSPSRRGHRRSVSAGPPLIYSSKSPAKTSLNGPSKPNSNVYLSGNICPSGKILKPNLTGSSGNRPTTLGSGTGNYGHGSVIRRAAERGNGGHLVEDSILKQGMARESIAENIEGALLNNPTFHTFNCCIYCKNDPLVTLLIGPNLNMQLGMEKLVYKQQTTCFTIHNKSKSNPSFSFKDSWGICFPEGLCGLATLLFLRIYTISDLHATRIRMFAIVTSMDGNGIAYA